MEILVPVVIALVGIVSTIISYRLGKQGKIDEIVLKEGYPIANQVSILFQKISEDDQYYFDFYHNDSFQNIKDIEEFSAYFENLPGNFSEEYQRIDNLLKAREELKDQLKKARLYLNYAVIEDIQSYLKLDQFWYRTTAYTDHNNFYEAFFSNIIDEKKHRRREKISLRVIKKLRKLIEH